MEGQATDMPDDYDYSQPRKSPLQKAGAEPYITYLLCALSVLMTAAFLTSSEMKGTLWYQIGHFGYSSAYSIWDGHVWVMFTSIFIHGSLFHIAFNMYWLWRMGRVVETSLHPIAYALFILTAAVVGSAAELLVSGETGIGMSGVGYALCGLMWAGRGRFRSWQEIATRETLNVFIIWGLICVVSTYFGFMQIANGAHGAGFLFGLSVGWVFLAPRRRTVWAIPLVLLCLMTVLAVTWVPWSNEWTFWKGNREFRRKHYLTAITWYRRSLQLGGDPETNWDNISRAWNNLAIEAANRHDAASEERATREAEQAAMKLKSLPSRPSE